MAPGLPPPITTASVRIARPASIVIYALFSAVLLAVSRRRLARARRDRRPAVVLATARIWVITARLGLVRRGGALAGDHVTKPRHAVVTPMLRYNPPAGQDRRMTERSLPKPGTVGTDLRVLRTYVSIDEWYDAMDRAEKAGLSLSRYLRMLLARDQLDADGRPVWVPHTTSSDELPGMEGSAA
jgi:hypothetical protein